MIHCKSFYLLTTIDFNGISILMSDGMLEKRRIKFDNWNVSMCVKTQEHDNTSNK